MTIEYRGYTITQTTDGWHIDDVGDDANYETRDGITALDWAKLSIDDWLEKESLDRRVPD